MSFFSSKSYPSISRIQKKTVEVEKKKAKAIMKEKAARIIGFLFTFIMCCVCLVFINILSAMFDSGLSAQWVLTFAMALFQDFFIAQIIKCLIIYFIALCIYNGGISPTKDQCLRWLGNNVAGKILAAIQ